MFSFYVTAKCLFKQAGPGENCEISKDYLHPFLTMLSTETFEDQSSEPCEMLINRLDSNISSLLWNRKYNYWSRSPFIIYSGSSWFWAELRILQSFDSNEKSQLFWGVFLPFIILWSGKFQQNRKDCEIHSTIMRLEKASKYGK